MKKKVYGKENMSLDDFKDFISRTYTGKYSGKYTLDESTWVDKDTPMMIHCREHGWFERIPSEFAEGFVCPYESNAIRNNIDWQKRAFLEKARIKFGGRFEYEIDTYTNSKNKIRILCNRHGWFNDTPDHHLSRVDGGCRECFKETMHSKFSKTSEDFIAESKQIWGNDAFDYSKTEYVNRNEKVTLICRKHGIEFTQVAYKHLAHHKQCPECLRDDNVRRNLMTKEHFVERANITHNGRYSYEKTDTKHRDEDGKVIITCPIHGDYRQNPNDHIYRNGCPKCAGLISRPEDEILSFVKSLVGNDSVIQRNHGILGGKEIDIYVPNEKIAIEFNGLHWHTEEFARGSEYHLSKLEECNKKGIKLIQIFEDEWLEHKEIVLSKIRHHLHKDKPIKKVRGHKCLIEEIEPSTARQFFEVNHIQGFSGGSIIIGAFFEGELVGSCIFKKNGSNCYELVRMATMNGYLCHGVCGKMFSYFVQKYNPIEIKSFADRRWTLNSEDNIYVRLGFFLEKTLKPDYRYVIGNKRMHKFGFRKHILHRKYGLPLTMTEKEMCNKLGFHRIWDCGLFKYLWKKQS